MPEAVWGWVNYYYLLIPAALVIWQLVRVCVHKHQYVQDIYTLDSDGTIRAVSVSQQDKTSPAWRLHRTSKLLPWGLVLNVESAATKCCQLNYEHLRWVLKGECPEADYRRLCRAIIKVHGASPTRNNIDVS